MAEFPIKKLVLATGNPFKARELRMLLHKLPVEILDLSMFSEAPEVSETGTTLAENARLKAQAIYDFCGLSTLADDTGLFVEALQGHPGVSSARFAGPNRDDRANRAKLLRALNGQEQRAANFVTVMAYAGSSGRLPHTHLFEGICPGHIAVRELTSGGFGYESVFIPKGHSRCFAQLTPHEKNAISHRGKAAHAFIRFLSPPA
ncbi:MAG: RdgB/HAM1 family non-canonical purine NTP pyrophosphatase [Bacteroidota bacterium]|nr:RdgB/HAM1 family non-canonical purine NTP pyrophosphatase [Bacteroidota bacterium]